MIKLKNLLNVESKKYPVFGPDPEDDPILMFLGLFPHISRDIRSSIKYKIHISPPSLDLWEFLIDSAKMALYFYEKTARNRLNENDKPVISDDILYNFLIQMSKETPHEVPSVKRWLEIIFFGVSCYEYYKENDKRN